MGQGSTAQRNSNVELLRILIMFGILLWHVTVHGFGLAHINAAARQIDFELPNAFCTALFAPCVNLFVLIPGYYGMTFRIRTLVRFDAQAIFYNVVVACVFCFVFGEIEPSKIINYFFPILGQQWWFLNKYILLLILSPILTVGISKLTKSQHLLIIILLLIIIGVGCLYRKEAGGGSNALSFIHIFIIGQFLRRYKDGYSMFTSRRKLAAGWTACVVLNFVAVYLCLVLGKQHSNWLGESMMWLGYSNPVIIFQSVCVLCFVLLFKPTFSKSVNTVARHVFAVYLITEAVGMHLYVPLSKLFVRNFFLGLLACVAVFAACVLVEAVRRSLYDRLERKTLARFAAEKRVKG